jgi:MoaA/NifB/PqqE/SkfB family radical SAM enzyme|tara:strand:- start:4830 stop:5855 length:1026 start_codon:yes stop_codon:yes gene_type:complete
MMDWKNNIRKLQIDLSSYCNAKCGACIRNVYGHKTQPGLKLAHFDVNLWNRLFAEDLSGIKIEKLSLNGNWGDACMHPDLPEMIKTMSKYQPKMLINIATNGSMHTPDWWKKLGMSVSKNPNIVDFAVDGLEDTHSIYRRGTDFNKIMANMKAFIDGGGYASWVMTEFDHNCHQVDEAIERAMAIGVGEFTLRPSHGSDMLIRSDTEEYIITTNKCSGKKVVKTFYEQELVSIFTDKNDTTCPWHNEGEIQIDPWGYVHPCCHISLLSNTNIRVLGDKKQKLDLQFPYVETNKKHGEFNNLHDTSLEDILTHIWYTTELSNAVAERTWEVCTNNCGDGNDI